MIKTIPKKRNTRRQNGCLRQNGLTNSCEKKRRENQRRNGMIYHLNEEYQRIARRDKKAFLNGQCKVIEVENKMGNTRDLVKKIRDTKGTFHEKGRHNKRKKQ